MSPHFGSYSCWWQGGVIGKSLDWENVESPSNQVTVIANTTITIGLQEYLCLPKTNYVVYTDIVLYMWIF